MSKEMIVGNDMGAGFEEGWVEMLELRVSGGKGNQSKNAGSHKRIQKRKNSGIPGGLHRSGSGRSKGHL